MPDYVARLARELLPDTQRQAAFLEAIREGKSARPALLWLEGDRFTEVWTDTDSPAGLRPGQHPDHAAGKYYCLDASSVFEASVLKAIKTPVKTILDLCASPGGKGIYAWLLFHPEVLVANEVIGKRLGALTGNLARCHVAPAQVTRLDSAVWATQNPSVFDLVIVDAPCSGQSLRARGEENPGAFHPSNVNNCMSRQRRIMANAAQTVAPGGYLAYMTCTYSREENEKVVAWLLKQCPDFVAIESPELAPHQSPHADFACYRLWPFEDQGAGGFTCLLQKKEEREEREGEFKGEAASLQLTNEQIVWRNPPLSSPVE